MKYKNYKKGSSALRRIINDEELEYSRHFAAFMFSMGEERRRGHMRGIYNQKTNNVIAFINARGNVFMRPNSVYFEKMLATKNKVIKHPNLRALRNKVPSHVKQAATWNVLAQRGADNLIANKDKPNKVYLFTITDSIDNYFINSRFQSLLKDSRKKFPNTEYALKRGGGWITEKDFTNKGTKIYLEIQDYSEIIAKQEREQHIKEEVAKLYLDNIQAIAENAIVTRSSMNPIQFTFTEDGETTEGVINLGRIDLTYPREMPLRDWVVPEMLWEIISFRDNIGTLVDQGIDEMDAEQRETERRTMQDYANRMWTANIPNDFYTYATSPGRTIRIDPATLTDYSVASDTAFGSVESVETIQAHHVVAPPLEIDDVTRAVDALDEW